MASASVSIGLFLVCNWARVYNSLKRPDWSLPYFHLCLILYTCTNCSIKMGLDSMWLFITELVLNWRLEIFAPLLKGLFQSYPTLYCECTNIINLLSRQVWDAVPLFIAKNKCKLKRTFPSSPQKHFNLIRLWPVLWNTELHCTFTTFKTLVSGRWILKDVLTTVVREIDYIMNRQNKHTLEHLANHLFESSGGGGGGGVSKAFHTTSLCQVSNNTKTFSKSSLDLFWLAIVSSLVCNLGEPQYC